MITFLKFLRHNSPLFRLFLIPLYFIYFIITKIRIFFYKIGFLHQHKAPVPVISIGNIDCGGSGKSPLCYYLIKKLNSLKILVLARGYSKNRESDIDDENIEHLNCKKTIKICHKNRIKAFQKFFQMNQADLILLDDGFQHLKIDRQVNILIINAPKFNKNERLLPLGNLRESFTEIKRATLIILSKCEQIQKNKLSELKKILTKDFKYQHSIICSYQKFKNLHHLADPLNELTINNLKDKKISAFCAIANPDQFKKTIEDQITKLNQFLYFDDHYQFKQKDIELIESKCKNDDYIICTQKDATKLQNKIIKSKIIILNIETYFSEKDEEILHSHIKEKTVLNY